MKLAIVIGLTLAGLAGAASAQSTQYVPGYFRADGTYVRGYYRVVTPLYYQRPVVQPITPRVTPYQGVPPVLQGIQQAQEYRQRQLELERQRLELQQQAAPSSGGG